MDLAPITKAHRDSLISMLCDRDKETRSFRLNKINYVCKTFPSVLVDIVRHLSEQATQAARNELTKDSAEAINLAASHQLKPFVIFKHLLGKCPQVTSYIYDYFETSSFQPLPSKLFKEKSQPLEYASAAIDDHDLLDILEAYFKYLSFNPKWFSAIWDWSQLIRLAVNHNLTEVRYLAACCLAIITRPKREDHLMFLYKVVAHGDKALLHDTQRKYMILYNNTFDPCIETKFNFADDFVKVLGASESGYDYCKDTLVKLSNVLLNKKTYDNDDSNLKLILDNYIPIDSTYDTISRIAYSVSINRPCLIRGPCGSGKTSIIDYIAAKTGNLEPPEYIKIQIGDQIDSRLLIGSYVCTNLPGQFQWHAGPLTKAMVSGAWIIFEDVDLAPADMIHVLYSVLENKNLDCIPSCPVNLHTPHPDFRIFFTMRSETKSDLTRSGLSFILKVCELIDIAPLSLLDIEHILTKQFKFSYLIPQIIKIYTASLNTIEKLGDVKLVTLRDLSKFCFRITKLNLDDKDSKISREQVEQLFTTAVDCFASFLPKDKMMQTAEKIGEALQLSPTQSLQIVSKRYTPRLSSTHYEIGKNRLPIQQSSRRGTSFQASFAYTTQSSILIQKIAGCIAHVEPVLLVGETGVGKTSMVQKLADSTKTRLHVVNLSQQSDSADLLGGFRPADISSVMTPFKDTLIELCKKTFKSDRAANFNKHIESKFIKGQTSKNWLPLVKLAKLLTDGVKKRDISDDLMIEWKAFLTKCRYLLNIVKSSKSSSLSMAFVEGTLIRCVRKGYWILLDEINLAEADVLQCLLQIMDNYKRKYVYMNEIVDDNKKLEIHPNFRMFACMNPSTDVCKKDLPSGIRNRFTELYVNEEMDTQDLRQIIESYVGSTLKNATQVEGIVKFYQEVRKDTKKFKDISGNLPTFSLRTLCRALNICANNVCCNVEKTLFESLKITFLQQLDETSSDAMIELLSKTVFPKGIKSLISTPIPRPTDGKTYVNVQGFWIQKGFEDCLLDERYIITNSVSKNIEKLASIISLGQRKLPILIQGLTSVGKTSIIMHIAKITGNKCLRLNNHEHTDLEEYIGRYILQADGSLVFEEGILVKAMKMGYWIILDELNLAPSDLLEALNRVLDDNREIYIPETKKTIKASSQFMLFATQNPPETYSGRKLLSRAFRNRFIELHFDEIPLRELQFILHKKCEIPEKYAEKIVEVLKQLQLERRETSCFYGKSSFMTLRDVFRWGERYLHFKKGLPDNTIFDYEQFVAGQGIILLEGKVRSQDEANVVMKTIEHVFKKKMDRESIYKQDFDKSNFGSKFKHIMFSDEFQRLFVQFSAALRYKEPVLLCGPTGCGKTTAVQLYSRINRLKLLQYNCHQNTESSDFIGSLRPNRQRIEEQQAPFKWYDGPLTSAMKEGSMFLMDEISLAEDAVLERINSVLEPCRTLTLTENVGEDIRALDSFKFVATMNPGGDFGKKELSPAMRNRLTEIYCYEISRLDQVVDVLVASLRKEVLKTKYLKKTIQVFQGFISKIHQLTGKYRMRDILSWVSFFNKVLDTKTQHNPFSFQDALIHGAAMVFLDQIGTCGFESNIIRTNKPLNLTLDLSKLVYEIFGSQHIYLDEQMRKSRGRFQLPMGLQPVTQTPKILFVCDAPTSRRNMEKIYRAMQLDKPILLEGDPGVGKTCLVSSLAERTGNRLIRFNLSEQTDISDLFGTDLPSNGSKDDSKPSFCWQDGPLLRAIKNSEWILLDELNLASQSVLEGLNACFDHRSEIFIPELGRVINIKRSSTRIFATQNPFKQGAARKGLPQSFLNRFLSIYIEPHQEQDLQIIMSNLNPYIARPIIDKMVKFNTAVQRSSALTNVCHVDYNLRDMIYWAELTNCSPHSRKDFKKKLLHQPERFVQFVYLDRLRNSSARDAVMDIYEEIFGIPVYEPPFRELRFSDSNISLGRAILPRLLKVPPHLSEHTVLKYQVPYLESMMIAIRLKKMVILTGQIGAGKRSMIRILAGVTGNILNVIGANSEMDTIELLGSYEQKSLTKDMTNFIKKATEILFRAFNNVITKELKFSTNFCSHMWQILNFSMIRENELAPGEILDCLVEILSHLKEATEIMLANDCLAASLKTELLGVINELSIIIKDTQKATPLISGKFEWMDSILVESIKNGSWLLIENANLMNPATLDRLNSLVESDGFLYVNEKGSGNKEQIECLRPHKNFRLFLTIDPAHGELSRAMRNRGTDIFVEPTFYFEDFLILLHQNGYFQLPSPDDRTLRSCMSYSIMQTCIEFHQKVTGEAEGGSLLTYFALNFLHQLTHQVRRGKDIGDAMAEILIDLYRKNGYVNKNEKDLHDLVKKILEEATDTYKVSLEDARYLWVNFKYDLFHLTGGDSVPPMVARDEKLLHHRVDVEMLNILKPDEIIESIPNVIFSIAIKLYFEFSTITDFDYRFRLLNICREEKIVSCLEAVAPYFKEYIAMANNIISELQPANSNVAEIDPTEFYVDTRNSPDLHYFLRMLNYKKMKKLEGIQNKWLLTQQVSMLRLILELNIKDSSNINSFSLLEMSNDFRENKIAKTDLIHPCVEIAYDLANLLETLLSDLGSRILDDNKTKIMLPRIFWLNYLLCKLQKRYTRAELIGVSNQIPIIWALTYQKIIKPLKRECELFDVKYRSNKLILVLGKICNFFDKFIGDVRRKFKLDDKLRYKVVSNAYAASLIPLDLVLREVTKFFRKMGQIMVVVDSKDGDRTETKFTSHLIFSNTEFFNLLKDFMKQIHSTELEHLTSQPHILSALMPIAENYMEKITTFRKQAEKNGMKLRLSMKQLFDIQSEYFASSQFGPLWQTSLLRLFLESHNNETSSGLSIDKLDEILSSDQALLISPRFYHSYIRFSKNNGREDLSKRELLNIHYSFVNDVLNEYEMLDESIVAWTRLRPLYNNVCEPLGPPAPEYSPLISFVSSYSMDFKNLRLISLSRSNQLTSFLHYCWFYYNNIKREKKTFYEAEIGMANKVFMLKKTADMELNLISCYDDIRAYLTHWIPIYTNFETSLDSSNFERKEVLKKAVSLICFGFLTYSENSPIFFSIDPALKIREKTDILKSELAHVKLELYLRNTLFYWKTGENLNLTDTTDADFVSNYPFSHRVFVERKLELETKIVKLQAKHIFRPLNDLGSQYPALKSEVECISRDLSENIFKYLDDFKAILGTKKEVIPKPDLMELAARILTLYNCLKKRIKDLKTRFSLFADLTTNYICGLSFVLKGMKQVASILEQFQAIQDINPALTYSNYNKCIASIMSLNSSGTLNSNVLDKLDTLKTLEFLASTEERSEIRLNLIASSINQLRFSAKIAQEERNSNMYLMSYITKMFYTTWKVQLDLIDTMQKKRDDLFVYKTSGVTLGGQSASIQEKLDITANFPTYEHQYFNIVKERLTEMETAEIIKEDKFLRYSSIINSKAHLDICKSQMDFIFDVSNSSHLTPFNYYGPPTDYGSVIKLETDMLYTILKRRIRTFDPSLDSLSLEYHMFGALNLLKQNTVEKPSNDYNIYYQYNVQELLVIKEYLVHLSTKVKSIPRDFLDNPTLKQVEKYIERLQSFTCQLPLMQYVTGCYSLVESLDAWNRMNDNQNIKLLEERERLVQILKRWRKIELISCSTMLSRVKQQFSDDLLRTWWPKLYDIFNSPKKFSRKFWVKKSSGKLRKLKIDEVDKIWYALVWTLKKFLDLSTYGDFETRLDLVLYFLLVSTTKIQSKRFDYKKLVVCVTNVYLQYRENFIPMKTKFQTETEIFQKELDNQITIVSCAQQQSKTSLDLKNSLKSHYRSLLKIINKYKEFLKKYLDIEDFVTKFEDRQLKNTVNFEKIQARIVGLQASIQKITCETKPEPCLKVSLNLTRTTDIFKKLNIEVTDHLVNKYIDCLKSIDDTVIDNTNYISKYFSHKVESIIISVKDDKETREEKLNQCRLMYHDRKGIVTSIFYKLQTLGLSYLRGNNSLKSVSKHIYQCQSLKNPTYMKNNFTSALLSDFIDNDIVNACINDYYQVLAGNQLFWATIDAKQSKIDAEFQDKMGGYSLDMIMNVSKHHEYSSNMYKDLIDLQTIKSRLDELIVRSKGQPIRAIKLELFKEKPKNMAKVLEKCFLLIEKSSILLECQKVVSQEDDKLHKMLLNEPDMNPPVSFEPPCKIDLAKQLFKEVNEQLIFMLEKNSSTHIHSDDEDIVLRRLREKLLMGLQSLMPSTDPGESDTASRTTERSLDIISVQVKQLTEELNKIDLTAKVHLDADNCLPKISSHPKFNKIDTRIQKAFIEMKLAIESVHTHEMMAKDVTNVTYAFNEFDSEKVYQVIRSPQVTTMLKKLILTFNLSDYDCDILPVITIVANLLNMYVQTVTAHLNVSLMLLHLKLVTAIQSISFFVGLVRLGFGLPVKMLQDESAMTNNTQQQSSDNMTGFGEGEGSKDVGERLEFESELDDLQGNDGPQDAHDSKDVAPDDKGIEVSDDIKDKEAVGGDEAYVDKDKKDGAAEEEPQQTDELDKVMDSVDATENNMPNKDLWGDEPEVEGDNEEDLNEGDLNQKSEASTDELQFNNKEDEESAEVESQIDEDLEFIDSEEETGADNGKESTSVAAPNEKVGEINDDSDKNQQESVGIDEMSSSKDKDSVQEDEDEPQTEKPDTEVETINDNGEDNEDGMPDKDSTEKVDEEVCDKEDDVDKTSEELEQPMEISDDEETRDQASNDTQKDEIDDEYLHHRLEKLLNNAADSMNGSNEENMLNNSDDLVKSSNEPADQNSTRHDKSYGFKAEQIGNYLVLNFEDIENNDDEETKQLDPTPTPTTNEESHVDLTPKPSNESSSNLESTQNQEKKDNQQDDVTAESSTNKRTLADKESNPTEEQEERQLKKAKIHETANDDKKNQEAASNQQSSSSTNRDVRHTSMPTKDAPEVIDLCSDEEKNTECEQMDPKDAPTSAPKPRESKSVIGESSAGIAGADDDLTNDDDTTKQLVIDDEALNESDPKAEKSPISQEDASDIKDISDEEEFFSPNITSDNENNLEVVEKHLEDEHNKQQQQNVESTFTTNYGLLRSLSLQRLADLRNVGENNKLLNEIDAQFADPRKALHPDFEKLETLWSLLTKDVDYLCQELCHHLAIVLQPSKMSKYKGDYKTGKRLNMRKIINYIASNFRKDKIWLRRLKPAKRNYQIALAIDNSSSMSENNCKYITYQTLALLAKSLTTLEAGQLGVLSFGEQVTNIHEFGAPYVSSVGAQWLRHLRFNERKTSYAKLLQKSIDSFEKLSAATTFNNSATSVSRLLVIISDGRNVSSDAGGDSSIKELLVKLKYLGVMTLFIIIDNLKANGEKSSIMDIKRCVSLPGGGGVRLASYMETFPFPFYVLLRRLEAMPSILGEALRQWFELVGSNTSL